MTRRRRSGRWPSRGVRFLAFLRLATAMPVSAQAIARAAVQVWVIEIWRGE